MKDGSVQLRRYAGLGDGKVMELIQMTGHHTHMAIIVHHTHIVLHPI